MSEGELDPAARERVGRRFRSDSGPFTDPVTRLADLVVDEAPLLTASQAVEWARRMAVDLVGLGALEHLLEDPTVTDVLVNGPGPVWVERSGRLVRTDLHLDAGEIGRAIERLVAPLGLQADRSHPITDGRLADGTRVTVVLPPLSIDGPVLAIRRHRLTVHPLEAFGDPAVVASLREAVVARRNIVVYGPTGSGKTSLVNALVGEVPASERIVTIEDVAELRLPGEHIVRLEARPGTAEGVGRVAIRELVRAALRLRPDRIVVGEVRGAESLDMLWALSTGHTGSMSTCHAHSPTDCLRRLVAFAAGAGEGLSVEFLSDQAADAVDLLVGVDRGPSGRRRVVHLARVVDGQIRAMGGLAAA